MWIDTNISGFMDIIAGDRQTHTESNRISKLFDCKLPSNGIKIHFVNSHMSACQAQTHTPHECLRCKNSRTRKSVVKHIESSNTPCYHEQGAAPASLLAFARCHGDSRRLERRYIGRLQYTLSLRVSSNYNC